MIDECNFCEQVLADKYYLFIDREDNFGVWKICFKCDDTFEYNPYIYKYVQRLLKKESPKDLRNKYAILL